MRVLNKTFRATFKSWDALFQEAANYATSIGRERLISISHSSENGQGIVVVWFWGEARDCPKCGYNLTGNTSGRCPECATLVSFVSDVTAR